MGDDNRGRSKGAEVNTGAAPTHGSHMDPFATLRRLVRPASWVTFTGILPF